MQGIINDNDLQDINTLREVNELLKKNSTECDIQNVDVLVDIITEMALNLSSYDEVVSLIEIVFNDVQISINKSKSSKIYITLFEIALKKCSKIEDELKVFSVIKENKDLFSGSVLLGWIRNIYYKLPPSMSDEYILLLMSIKNIIPSLDLYLEFIPNCKNNKISVEYFSYCFPNMQLIKNRSIFSELINRNLEEEDLAKIRSMEKMNYKCLRIYKWIKAGVASSKIHTYIIENFHNKEKELLFYKLLTSTKDKGLLIKIARTINLFTIRKKTNFNIINIDKINSFLLIDEEKKVGRKLKKMGLNLRMINMCSYKLE